MVAVLSCCAAAWCGRGRRGCHVVVRYRLYHENRRKARRPQKERGRAKCQEQGT